MDGVFSGMVSLFIDNYTEHGVWYAGRINHFECVEYGKDVDYPMIKDREMSINDPKVQGLETTKNRC